MEPLDLTTRPPRSPNVRLGGMILLARTIDKLRATLPGGKLGVYTTTGFSSRMLDALRISQDDLRDVVARAEDDAAVVAWVLAHSDAAARESMNDTFSRLCIADRVDRPDFFERYPGAKDLPHDTSLLDMLEHDDRLMFGR